MIPKGRYASLSMGPFLTLPQYGTHMFTTPNVLSELALTIDLSPWMGVQSLRQLVNFELIYRRFPKIVHLCLASNALGAEIQCVGT